MGSKQELNQDRTECVVAFAFGAIEMMRCSLQSTRLKF